MKTTILNVLLGFIIILFAFQSCEDDENETKISSFTSSESHNTGQNCMNCHKEGGSGEGVFTTAGTVYQSNQTTTYPGATVKLYTEPDGGGTLIATIAADQRGNFYTTQSINFANGLYVQVEGLGTKNMLTSITTGACNSCHGNQIDPIWTE